MTNLAFLQSDNYKLFLDEVIDRYQRYNNFDKSYYSKIAVKRGLRNSDGTGVVAGLTKICNVHGYIIDEGEKRPCDGELTYRGINIADIINGITTDKRFGFEETAYLLLFGKLPNEYQLERFKDILFEASILSEEYCSSVISGTKTTDYMNKLSSCIVGLYPYDPAADDCSLENSIRQSVELIAKFPLIIGNIYLNSKGDKKAAQLSLNSRNRSIAESFLAMIRGDKGYTEEEVRLLDICLVLHAEHGGGNNSTFTTRVLTSSGTDIYGTIAGAVNSLKGPKHGGANLKVTSMIDCIAENVKDWEDEQEVAEFLEKILRKEAHDGSGLIYGMGHAIYTLSDPRAMILKRFAEHLASENEQNMKKLMLIESVEKLSPNVYSKCKKNDKEISANVDMYSGFVYNMLGIPQQLFTPIFALSRVTGWCAHRLEEITTGGRIIRPAYKSIATPNRYTPLELRK